MLATIDILAVTRMEAQCSSRLHVRSSSLDTRIFDHRAVCFGAKSRPFMGQSVQAVIPPGFSKEGAVALSVFFFFGV